MPGFIIPGLGRRLQGIEEVLLDRKVVCMLHANCGNWNEEIKWKEMK